MPSANSPAERTVASRSEGANARAASRQPVAPARILTGDDISDNRTVLLRRFERRGFEVVETDSGLKALDLIASQEFDVILLDVMMPEIDGIETLKRIRSTRSPSELPVIMVTAKSESENVVDALGFGANDYVTKPVDFAVALARVNTQIGRRRAEKQVITANGALRDANDNLEKNVADRTQLLLELYQKLRAEMAVREE